MKAALNRTKTIAELKWSLFIGALAAAFAAALCSYLGVSLNPFDVAWLLREDPGTHYLGFEFFRSSPWGWPLGWTDRYGYPGGASVSLTDSIPLFALPTKLLLNLLGVSGPFQYFGIFFFCALFAQFFLSATLARWVLSQGGRVQTTKWLDTILVAGWLTMSPVLIYRAQQHLALTAHALLISAGLLVCRESPRLVWLALLAVAFLIHPYFWAMLLLIWVLKTWVVLGWSRPLAGELKFLLPVLGLTGVLGAALGTFQAATGPAGGYTQFQSNLNTFLNALSYSQWLPGLSIGGHGQKEGFAYLGIGGWVVSLWGAFTGAWSNRSRRFWGALGVVFALALSVDIYLGDWKIISLFKALKWIGLTQLLSQFRASGRFIWILWYAIVLISLIHLLRRDARALVRPLLGALLTLQFFEFTPLWNEVRAWHQSGPQVAWKCPLEPAEIAAVRDRPWMRVPTAYDPQRIFAIWQCGGKSREVYMGRSNEQHVTYLQQLSDRALIGDLQSDTIYWFEQGVRLPEFSPGWTLRPTPAGGLVIYSKY